MDNSKGAPLASVAACVFSMMLYSFIPHPPPVTIPPVVVERDIDSGVIAFEGHWYVAAMLDGDVCIGTTEAPEGSCHRAVPAPSIQ